MLTELRTLWSRALWENLCELSFGAETETLVGADVGGAGPERPGAAQRRSLRWTGREEEEAEGDEGEQLSKILQTATGTSHCRPKQSYSQRPENEERSGGVQEEAEEEPNRSELAVLSAKSLPSRRLRHSQDCQAEFRKAVQKWCGASRGDAQRVADRVY